jgi:hypothetical protein
MEQLAEKYAGEVDFVFIYCKEAHPGAAPPIANAAEMLAQARRFVQEMNVKQRVLVDDFEERSVQGLYGSFSNSGFVLDRDGRVILKLAITDPVHIEDTVREQLGKPPVEHTHPLGMSGARESANPVPSPRRGV